MNSYSGRENVGLSPTAEMKYKFTCFYCKAIRYTDNKDLRYCSSAHRRAQNSGTSSVNNKTYTVNVRGY